MVCSKEDTRSGYAVGTDEILIQVNRPRNMFLEIVVDVGLHIHDEHIIIQMLIEPVGRYPPHLSLSRGIRIDLTQLNLR
jgi:hypothetical protein